MSMFKYRYHYCVLTKWCISIFLLSVTKLRLKTTRQWWCVGVPEMCKHLPQVSIPTSQHCIAKYNLPTRVWRLTMERSLKLDAFPPWATMTLHAFWTYNSSRWMPFKGHCSETLWCKHRDPLWVFNFTLCCVSNTQHSFCKPNPLPATPFQRKIMTKTFCCLCSCSKGVWCFPQSCSWLCVVCLSSSFLSRGLKHYILVFWGDRVRQRLHADRQTLAVMVTWEDELGVVLT